MKFQNALTFFCLKMFPSQKKLLVNTNFVKMILDVNEVHEKLWGIHVSSNNLAYNGFASLYHLKVKMVTYNFEKLLSWKRSFPQVQFLLLITFKSDSLALIWPKSLSRGWPLYALRNQLYGNAVGPNESRDTQCSDNWWTLQPIEHTITAAAEYAPVLHN